MLLQASQEKCSSAPTFFAKGADDECYREGPGKDHEVTVRFRVTAPFTRPGDAIVAVGSAEEMGRWRVEDAVRMSTSPSTFPEWQGEATLTFSEKEVPGVEFKFVLIPAQGPYAWEATSNRRPTFALPPEMRSQWTKEVWEVSAAWQGPEGYPSLVELSNPVPPAPTPSTRPASPASTDSEEQAPTVAAASPAAASAGDGDADSSGPDRDVNELPGAGTAAPSMKQIVLQGASAAHADVHFRRQAAQKRHAHTEAKLFRRLRALEAARRVEEFNFKAASPPPSKPVEEKQQKPVPLLLPIPRRCVVVDKRTRALREALYIAERQLLVVDQLITARKLQEKDAGFFIEARRAISLFKKELEGAAAYPSGGHLGQFGL